MCLMVLDQSFIKTVSGILRSCCFLGTLPLVPKGQSEFLRDAFIFGQRDDLLKTKNKKPPYHQIIFL